VQTPQQRKANEKFKKAQDAKRGKPASEIKKRENFKSPISPLWLGKSSSFLTMKQLVYAVRGLKGGDCAEHGLEGV
jgi:Ribosome associated membrane protein RAMP4